jgi:NAD-dependent dihydropyrimidine dehydrogenase PreA subunit
MSEYEKKMLAGVDRQLVHWNPRINTELCNQCLSCVEFCPRHVFEEKNGLATVETPSSCVIFCDRCESICPNHAISHPTRAEFLKEVRDLRKKGCANFN